MDESTAEEWRSIVSQTRENQGRVADSVVTMGLEHAVVTSVNRDELKNGGAEIYAEVIRQIHARQPGCTVEVRVPDFKGNETALRIVVEAGPEILAHNIDTVERLSKHPSREPAGTRRRARTTGS